MDALELQEKNCRERLCAAPDDWEMRLNLAWCLLLRALYCAGQESQTDVGPAPSRADSGALAPVVKRLSDSLLEDSGNHLCTVLLLNSDPEIASQTETLCKVMGWIGAERPMRAAKSRTEDAMIELARAVVCADRS